MLNLHDYFITGIQIDAKRKAAILLLTDPSGSQKRELVFPDVLILFVDSFGLQNVVLEAKIFFENEDSFEYKRACDLLDINPSDNTIFRDAKTLVFIEASVGAEVACLMSGQPIFSFD